MEAFKPKLTFNPYYQRIYQVTDMWSLFGMICFHYCWCWTPWLGSGLEVFKPRWYIRIPCLVESFESFVPSLSVCLTVCQFMSHCLSVQCTSLFLLLWISLPLVSFYLITCTVSAAVLNRSICSCTKHLTLPHHNACSCAKHFTLPLHSVCSCTKHFMLPLSSVCSCTKHHGCGCTKCLTLPLHSVCSTGPCTPMTLSQNCPPWLPAAWSAPRQWRQHARQP